MKTNKKLIELEIERVENIVCSFCIADECPEGYQSHIIFCVECKEQAKRILLGHNLAVIVEKELPENPFGGEGGWAIKAQIYGRDSDYREAQQDMLKAGYKKVIPLELEDTNDKH